MAALRAHLRHDLRPPEGNADLTAPGTTLGTPAYMAPAQLAGEALDRRADVFSFAVSAWELLLGERPFIGASIAALRLAMQAPPTLPPHHNVPAYVIDVLRRGLAHAASDRYADMHELTTALSRARRRTRKRIAVGIAAGGAMLAVLAGVAGARVLTSSPDPCADTTTLRLATAANRLGAPRAKIEAAIAGVRATHGATCDAQRDPPQSAEIEREASSLWPMLHAEALYTLGVVQANAGDSAAALVTLRSAAATAERAHHHHIATAAWTVLASHVSLESDAKRALEYIPFAEAALERIDRKPILAANVHYTKGIVYAQLERNADADREFTAALEIATVHAPAMLASIVHGHGYVLEDHAQYEGAIALYRRAVAAISKQAHPNEVDRATFRIRLGASLAKRGQFGSRGARWRGGVRSAAPGVESRTRDRTSRARATSALHAHTSRGTRRGNARARLDRYDQRRAQCALRGRACARRRHRA
jgi:tetratricopeptide (TPR) repeat protein